MGTFWTKTIRSGGCDRPRLRRLPVAVQLAAMTETAEIQRVVQEGDVYRFSYNAESQPFDPHHCFDGQLIARWNGGRMSLEDTYWGFAGGSSNRWFYVENAKEKGALTFVCNLSEVVDIEHYNLHYWAREDVFNLSHQHGCYKKFVRRKDALRSKEAMLSHLYGQLQEARQEVNSALSKVERAAKKIQEVETSDDLNEVYI